MRSKLSLLFLLLLACSDTLLFRSGANYFPLVPGSRWKYLLGGDTVYVEVDTLPAVQKNQNCIRVYYNAAPEYYTASPTEVRQLVVNTIARPNAPDTVEYRFALRYGLPLVLGNTFGETFETTLVYGPDTLSYRHTLHGRVAAIEEVSTPAGTFYDCYRLEFNERVFARETTETSWTEWLAPEVGLVRRTRETEQLILIEYRR